MSDEVVIDDSTDDSEWGTDFGDDACDKCTCGHDRSYHKNREYECEVEECPCEKFNEHKDI